MFLRLGDCRSVSHAESSLLLGRCYFESLILLLRPGGKLLDKLRMLLGDQPLELFPPCQTRELLNAAHWVLVIVVGGDEQRFFGGLLITVVKDTDEAVRIA